MTHEYHRRSTGSSPAILGVRIRDPNKEDKPSAPKPPDNVRVKTIQLQKDDPSKTALIGTGLSDK